MTGAPAPEAAFEAPWQARAFALAVTTVEGLRLPWTAFQRHLVAAIAVDPDRPYYESWVTALEDMVAEHGVV